jgi:hypothetical protein
MKTVWGQSPEGFDWRNQHPGLFIEVWLEYRSVDRSDGTAACTDSRIDAIRREGEAAVKELEDCLCRLQKNVETAAPER